MSFDPYAETTFAPIDNPPIDLDPIADAPTPAEAVAWLRGVAAGKWPTANATSAAAPVLVAELDRLQAVLDKTALAAANRTLRKAIDEKWSNP